MKLSELMIFDNRFRSTKNPTWLNVGDKLKAKILPDINLKGEIILKEMPLTGGCLTVEGQNKIIDCLMARRFEKVDN